MESIESLIPDNEGNHLVVVLSFYDDTQKLDTFQIPSEFINLDIADISIAKLNLDAPLGLRAFYQMCHWLIDQFTQFPDAVFTYICSVDPLATNHNMIAPEQYRWRLFEAFYQRFLNKLNSLGIEAKDIVVGPEGYQTFAKNTYP
ncbi:MAG: hypothetical protein K2M87_05655 [Muribaculaceae bacterium]|nr:hypothetical protein [Muribaculaceae bacterium]